MDTRDRFQTHVEEQLRRMTSLHTWRVFGLLARLERYGLRGSAQDRKRLVSWLLNKMRLSHRSVELKLPFELPWPTADYCVDESHVAPRATSAKQRAAACEGRPVIVFAPASEWGERLRQRPNQLLIEFDRLGVSCVYTSFGGRFDRAGVYEIAEHSTLVVGDDWAEITNQIVAGSSRTCLITWAPNTFAADIIDHDIWTYELIDALDVFEGQSGLRQKQERAIAQADLVVASARTLQDSARELKADCAYVPNGVDFDHFAMAAEPVAAELEGLPKPILGYHGALARWLDYRLIFEVAERLQGSLVFVGPSLDNSAEENGLFEHPKVLCVGPRPYAEVASYVQAFDVGWVPFKTGDLADATSPIKLFEFAAAGVPVVAPVMRELVETGICHIFDDAQDCVQRIEALGTSEPGLATRLSAFGKQNSWGIRARAYLELLSPLGFTVS